MEAILRKIKSILVYVSQNPRNASFNHSLFEVMACLVYHVCKQGGEPAVASFEDELFDVFKEMLGTKQGTGRASFLFLFLFNCSAL